MAKKQYNEMEGIGKAKYTVSFHDGIKTHSDGSAFFDIKIFSSKRQKDEFVKSLIKEGYTQ